MGHVDFGRGLPDNLPLEGAFTHDPAIVEHKLGDAPLPEPVASASRAYECRIFAGDPYRFVDRFRRRTVVGPGYQLCDSGTNQTTQICLYKQHHFAFFGYFKKTRCTKVIRYYGHDYQAAAAHKGCDQGTGRWRTVTTGAIDDEDGAHVARVRSDDRSIPNCN